MEPIDISDRIRPAATAVFTRGVRSLALLPSSAEALLVWAAAEHFGRTVVWVGHGPEDLETRHRDLAILAPTRHYPLVYYPALETQPNQNLKPDEDLTGARMEALLALMDAGPHVITTSIQALMQKTIAPSWLVERTFKLALNQPQDLDTLTARLSETGYAFVHEVTERGQTSVRGGILDLWPPNEDWPVRLEFFGSDLESIRTFDPSDQRSRESRTSVRIPPANEGSIRGDAPPSLDSLLAYLPRDAVFFWSDIDSVADHADRYRTLVAETGDQDLAYTFESLRAEIARRSGEASIGIETAIAGASEDIHGIAPPSNASALPERLFEPDSLEASRHRLWQALRNHAAGGDAIILFLETRGARDHFRSRFDEADVSGVEFREGALSEGFIWPAARLVVVASSDIYGCRKSSARRYAPRGEGGPSRISGARLADFTDMEPGDLVVHADHGLGRYLGLNEILFHGQTQEVLTIEYAEGAKLHVPVSQAHLLSRYIGGAPHAATLHTLGGKRWGRERAAAERAMEDMAASLLEVQAHRETLEGHAFPADTPWQHDFETSFPYRETVDQERVIREVKADMESSRPMDRLVCGDAGYGKTEVAMRAAFKAVMNAKQDAVLVPTTVLALQHAQTFTERMAGYPIRIEMLSRFRNPAQRAAILNDLSEGRVDILIGTHALVQPGIQFRNLGLVIIDEEQRFGVRHKERLKQLRRLVDVLTLTATPIPRTLYLSMTGARDMSLLQTPPRERMAIETIVTRNTDTIVREAILREVSRDGQVFYLHNRVMTIDLTRQRIERIVPEIRLAVAHGQMAAHELRAAMRRFTSGEAEVLLCTTIIESGMDIPRANTILIDRADRFGLADLYQLRGRVGRSSRQAYAYLLLPPHGQVDADADKRIRAIKKYSSLSAGFHLALRDLEIRGAGNILGAEQSGHIAAVGFSLYCQLLRRTVARLRNEPLPPVVDVEVLLDFVSLSATATEEQACLIPYRYIEEEPLRIGVYRKLAEAATESDVNALREEIEDRFGPRPPPVERLLVLARLRIAATAHGIVRVDVRDDKVRLTRGGEPLMCRQHFPRLTAATPDDRLQELLTLIETVDEWSA